VGPYKKVPKVVVRAAALVQLDQKEAIRGLRIPWQVLVPSLLTFQ